MSFIRFFRKRNGRVFSPADIKRMTDSFNNVAEDFSNNIKCLNEAKNNLNNK